MLWCFAGAACAAGFVCERSSTNATGGFCRDGLRENFDCSDFGNHLDLIIQHISLTLPGNEHMCCDEGACTQRIAACYYSAAIQ